MVNGQLIRAGLAAVAPRGVVGIFPNEPHQARGVFHIANYDLAIVEFDDQGRCYSRAQMLEVADWLTARAGGDVIIVVFVHGWKHDARSDDSNLESFQRVLDDTVRREQQEVQHSGGAARPVLGVFVGWRGMSLYDRYGVLENLTFWDREDAGQKVAVGSVRELFGRFRHYRNRRIKDGGAPLLVIVGHSFGGMIVYSALAQSLIEAASTTTPQIRTRFADLVLLVNPAFEAVRYLPIYDQLQERGNKGLLVEQPPVFVCAAASNDWATGIAFPIGNAYTLLTQSWRGAQERQAMIHTMGNLDWLRTHRLDATTGDPGYVLTAEDSGTAPPYWVVSTTSRVINGHNGIFKEPFLRFVAALVFTHVAATRAQARVLIDGSSDGTNRAVDGPCTGRAPPGSG